MKNLGKILASAILCFGLMGHAEETVSEKAAATGNDVKRGTKKAWNRTKEAVCMEGDLECAAKKAKNRAGEGAEYVGDKAKEAKNAVDSDSNNK